MTWSDVTWYDREVKLGGRDGMWRSIVRQIPSHHFSSPETASELYGFRLALHRFIILNSPIRYLEVGCRLGHSLAVVALSAGFELERATAIDMWVEGYGDEPNPGPDTVMANLGALGVNTSKLNLITGDSHEVLPTITDAFNLITVDGDHTYEGACRDLQDCLPLLEVGGLLVFDDAVDHLLEAWRFVTGAYDMSAGYDCFEVPDTYPWCGAVRLR